MDGENYDSQDHASIAASHSKNEQRNVYGDNINGHHAEKFCSQKSPNFKHSCSRQN